MNNYWITICTAFSIGFALGISLNYAIFLSLP